MKGLPSRRPSASLVIAILALVMATVGTGYAAFKLPKNSVGSKQLKKNSVTKAKIKKNAVNGAKVKDHSLTGADINLAKLGTVPAAETANTVPPREGTHLVGASGEPAFEEAGNFPAELGVSTVQIGFFKDHDDVVHLEGIAKLTGPFIFTLPPGFRPPSGTIQFFEQGNDEESGSVIIAGSNVVIGPNDISGKVIGSNEFEPLSGISFRAGS
jgi:hypothetical protein